MRYWVCLLSTVLLAAAELAADTVQGYVLNPLTETRVANAQVTFFIEQDGQLNEILRKESDAQGRFSFSGPFLTADVRFVLAASYRDAPYPTSTLGVGEYSQVILEVYEPTASDAQIRIAQHDLVINLGAASVSVGHLVQVDNRGDSTYVGRGQGQERQVTEFALPTDLFNLHDQDGGLAQANPGQFFDNRPLPPGTSQIGFSFDLDPRQLDEGYLYTATYATAVVNVLIQPSDIQVSSPFTDLGEVAFHDQNYRHLQLIGVQPGQSTMIPLSLPRPTRWLLKWVALSGALLSALLVLFISRQPTAPRDAATLDAEEDVLRRQRDDLLGQLARLDDAYGDRPDQRSYLDERTRLMDQTLALYLLLEKLNERG